jgi:hypothetical protein
MRLHAGAKAHPISSPHLRTTNDRQLAVAKPTEQSDLPGRHARRGQAGQIFAPALQHYMIEPYGGHVATKCAACQETEKVIASAYRSMELVRIDEAEAAAAWNAAATGQEAAPAQWCRRIPARDHLSTARLPARNWPR